MSEYDDSPPPQVKPFVAAAGRALQNPIVPAFERLKKAQPPYNKIVDYLDVVAAVGSIPGTSNQFRTRGPALLVVDGFNNSLGGSNTWDFGYIPLWIQMESAGADERGQILGWHNEFFLPSAGTYFLRGYLAETPVPGPIVSAAAHFFTSLYEGVELSAVINHQQSKRTARMGQMLQAQVINAATGTAIRRPIVDGSKIPPGTLADVNGMSCHAYKVTIGNEGANPAFISPNKKLTAASGIPLPALGSVSVEIPPCSTVYIFSTLGTTISSYWEYV